MNPAEKLLVFDDGASVPFDYLVLAPGATHSCFGHEEWSAFAPGLKTLDDALGMRRRMLLAFEEAEREVDLERKRLLLTLRWWAADPPASSWPGPWQRSRITRCATSSMRSIPRTRESY